MSTDKSLRANDRTDPRPTWDSGRHTLYFRGRLIKHFKRPAPGIEPLLDALQGDNWSGWTNNPYSAEAGRTRKQILHQAIQNFNRRLDNPLIALRSDGYGMRVRWEEKKIGTKRRKRRKRHQRGGLTSGKADG